MILVDDDQILSGSAISVHSWERDLQTCLVDFLVKPKSDVLEIGLGLGMAYRAIELRNPKSHQVIESSKEVIAFHRSRDEDVSGLIEGDWRDIAPDLRSSSFDAIYFDADPEDIGSFDGRLDASWRFAEPAVIQLRRLLKAGGCLGFLDFSCMISGDSKISSFLAGSGYKLSNHSVAIDPPKSCYYAPRKHCHLIKLTKISI